MSTTAQTAPSIPSQSQTGHTQSFHQPAAEAEANLHLQTLLQSISTEHTTCPHAHTIPSQCPTHRGQWSAAYRDRLAKEPWIGAALGGRGIPHEVLHSKDGSAVDVRSMQGNLERLRARAAMEMLVGSDRMRGFEDHRVVALRRQIGEGDQGDWREGWMQVQRLLDELRGQVTDEQARKEEVFAKAKDDAERIHVISNFLCDPQAGDSPADSSLKAKWRKLFADFTEGRVTAVDLVRTLKRDVEGMHKKEKDAMNELSDLVSAQTAKGKEKEEAEEKRRKAEAEARKSCERCGKVVSGENEVCCVRCWEGRGREKMVGGWYCSEECGREDAKGHNERYHKQS